MVLDAVLEQLPHELHIRRAVGFQTLLIICTQFMRAVCAVRVVCLAQRIRVFLVQLRREPVPDDCQRRRSLLFAPQGALPQRVQRQPVSNSLLQINLQIQRAPIQKALELFRRRGNFKRFDLFWRVSLVVFDRGRFRLCQNVIISQHGVVKLPVAEPDQPFVRQQMVTHRIRAIKNLLLVAFTPRHTHRKMEGADTRRLVFQRQVNKLLGFQVIKQVGHGAGIIHLARPC